MAFANTEGGSVIIGVKDNGEIIGVDISQESVQQWVNEIKSKTSPAIIPDVDVCNIEGKNVVCFKVNEYPIKPLSLQGKYYKRVGNSNHLMSSSEISDTYMFSMQYSWDSYIYPNASFEDLNIESVKRFIEQVNSKDRFKLPTKPKDALNKLNLLRDNKPTNAAMLLFSKKDLMYNVHIGRFKTPSMIIADNMISGRLYEVVEKSMEVILSHIKFAFEITGKTTQRKEIPEYPLSAIRELLLNAIVHRDYQSPTDVQIKIFDEKITFFNPSGLYGNITIEELQTNNYTASTRNKLIAEAFYLTHDIEKYGSGFIRVREAIKDYPTMKFSFSVVGNGCLSELSYKRKIKDEKLPIKTTDKTTDKTTTEKILNILKKQPNLTTSELADMCDITSDGIRWQIRKLKKEGLLERVGGKKGGYWEVKEK